MTESRDNIAPVLHAVPDQLDLSAESQARGDKVVIRCPPGGFIGRIDDTKPNIGGSRFLQKVLDFIRDGAD